MATANRILVIDPDGSSLAPDLGQELAALGYEAEISANGESVHNGRTTPTAILLRARESVGNGEIEPEYLIEIARRKHPQSYLPVLAINGVSGANSDNLHAHADAVMHGPITASSIVSRIRALRRKNAIRLEHQRRLTLAEKFGCDVTPDDTPETAPLRALYVGEPIHTIGLQSVMPDAVELVAALSPANAEDYLENQSFDLIALGFSPEMNAALIETWRRNPDLAVLPMIAIAIGADHGQIADLHSAGATEILTDPFDSSDVEQRIERLSEASLEADRLRNAWTNLKAPAIVDEATGVYHRKFGLAHLRLAMQDARATGDPLSVVVLNIGTTLYDDLTATRSSLDKVIAEKIGRTLQLVLRGEDMIARLDDTKFLIVMPVTDTQEADVAANRISAILRNTPFQADQDRSAILADIDVGTATLSDHDTALFFIMDAMPPKKR